MVYPYLLAVELASYAQLVDHRLGKPRLDRPGKAIVDDRQDGAHVLLEP